MTLPKLLNKKVNLLEDLLQLSEIYNRGKSICENQIGYELIFKKPAFGWLSEGENGRVNKD